MRIGGWSFTGWRRRSGAALGVVLDCDLVVWTASGWSRPVGWVMAGVAAYAVALVVAASSASPPSPCHLRRRRRRVPGRVRRTPSARQAHASGSRTA